jgi:hypothetical protein
MLAQEIAPGLQDQDKCHHDRRQLNEIHLPHYTPNPVDTYRRFPEFFVIVLTLHGFSES